MTDQTEQLAETIEAAVIIAPEPELTVEGETPEVEAEAGEETVVTFGDDEAPETKETPGWVKELRKHNRDLNKTISGLKKQIEAGNADEETALGAEPKLEDCDYDEGKWKGKWLEWNDDKGKIDAKAKTVRDDQERQSEAWNVRLTEYQEGRADFDADSFDEAESAVKDELSETQQGILIQAFGSKAAPLIRGLGQDDKRLKELAKISDPVLFTVAITRLESAMKVSSRKPRTVPETSVKGNSSSAAIGDNQLEKLRDEAAKTGDMSKVVAYKRKLKAG